MDIVRLERVLPATTARVWAAIGTPSGIEAWQADQVQGELVAGGTLELGWPSLGASVTLQVEECVPSRLLVLNNGATRVRFELDDRTLLVSQDGVNSEDERAGTASAWEVSLGMLEHYLTHHDGEARRVDWFVAEAQTRVETASVFFSELEALASWLATPGSARQNERGLELCLPSGRRLSGQCIAKVPGRDCCFSWSETAESALVLRTLPLPFGPEARLVLLGWSRWRELPDETHILLELRAAHARLLRLLNSAAQA